MALLDDIGTTVRSDAAPSALEYTPAIERKPPISTRQGNKQTVSAVWDGDLSDDGGGWQKVLFQTWGEAKSRTLTIAPDWNTASNVCYNLQYRVEASTGAVASSVQSGNALIGDVRNGTTIPFFGSEIHVWVRAQTIISVGGGSLTPISTPINSSNQFIGEEIQYGIIDVYAWVSDETSFIANHVDALTLTTVQIIKASGSPDNRLSIYSPNFASSFTAWLVGGTLQLAVAADIGGVKEQPILEDAVYAGSTATSTNWIPLFGRMLVGFVNVGGSPVTLTLMFRLSRG
jgi:hypothetical protein